VIYYFQSCRACLKHQKKSSTSRSVTKNPNFFLCSTTNDQCLAQISDHVFVQKISLLDNAALSLHSIKNLKSKFGFDLYIVNYAKIRKHDIFQTYRWISCEFRQSFHDGKERKKISLIT